MNPEQLKREIDNVFQIVKERSSAEELCIICPVPGCGDKSGNRSINLKTMRTHCWRCSDKQPSHVKSLFRIAGVEFVDNYVLQPAEVREILRSKPGTPLTPVQDVKLPDGFQLLSENRNSCYWKFCREMAERKNLGIEDLENANAGFTREGDWEPFCIFPVIEGPRIVYYQGRTYNDEGRDKTKKFPSKRHVHYGSSYWVYNLDALADIRVEKGIIVESILNVLSIRRRLKQIDLSQTIVPVCIFTHHLSRPQLVKLRRYKHIKEWYLLFDSDSTEMAHDIAIAINAALPVRVAEMPQGLNEDGSVRKTNDANDDVDKALIAVCESKPTSPNRIHRVQKYPSRHTPYPS